MGALTQIVEREIDRIYGIIKRRLEKGDKDRTIVVSEEVLNAKNFKEVKKILVSRLFDKYFFGKDSESKLKMRILERLGGVANSYEKE